MRSFDEQFKIDGQPILTPDAGVSLHLADLDDADAGRDEAGFMHRSLARSKVRTWGFTYSFLSREEQEYLLGLFENKATFTFTDGEKSYTAYCAQVDTNLFSRKHGLYKATKFNIIQC